MWSYTKWHRSVTIMVGPYSWELSTIYYFNAYKNNKHYSTQEKWSILKYSTKILKTSKQVCEWEVMQVYACCSIIFARYSRCLPGYRVGSSRPLGASGGYGARCGSRCVSLHVGQEFIHDAFELTECRTIFSPGVEGGKSKMLLFSSSTVVLWPDAVATIIFAACFSVATVWE